MPTLGERAAELSSETDAELKKLLVLGTPGQSAAAKTVLDARSLVALNQAIATFREGTQRFVDLTAGLQAVIDAIKVNPVGDTLDRFSGYLAEAESLLAELHATEAMASATVDAEEAAAPVDDLPAAPSGPVPVQPAAAPVALAAPPSAAPGPAIGAGTEFAELKNEYQALFDSCAVRSEAAGDVAFMRGKLLAFRDRYRAVGDGLGIPWVFIGIIHALESSFNFGTHLHNGDPLTAKTKRVPIGRPNQGSAPFSWADSATDALKMKGFDGQGDWSVPAMLYRWERYNGLGYRKRGLRSPYLWSFSNHYQKGKFVRDHAFDPEAVSKQCGAGTLLRDLVNRGELVIG